MAAPVPLTNSAGAAVAAASPEATAPRKYDYDLFTIGAGSGGVATSRRAADAGAKVGLAEYSRMGYVNLYRTLDCWIDCLSDL
jgi:hypothetical protein